jgi:hypothetical protein
VFEFRLRILDVRERETDPCSYLGIVEGFPQVMVHSTSIERAEIDLTNALIEHLTSMVDRDATRPELDDYPTVMVGRLRISAVTR